MKADELKAKLDKKYPQTIHSGEALTKITVPRISSGSFIFDLLTGGGIPRNRFTVFHGPKSSSKSTFAMKVVGEFQRANPGLYASYIDFEGTFDWDWADHFLVDKERFHLSKPAYGEEGIDIVKEYATNAEDVGLLVVDSLAGIVATAEADASAADNTQIGLQVKLVNRMIRILIPPMAKASRAGRQLTVLLINQVRANMAKAGPYSPAYIQPCGKFLEHAATMDVRFYVAEHTKVGGTPYLAKHKFQVEKNKVGLPKRTGDLNLYIAEYQGHKPGDMDEDKAVVAYAKKAGIVSREGAKWHIHTKKEPIVFDSLPKLLDTLAEDRKLFEKLRSATLRECIANPLLGSADEGTGE